jgi:hypothetical protein
MLGLQSQFTGILVDGAKTDPMRPLKDQLVSQPIQMLMMSSGAHLKAKEHKIMS